MEKIKPETPDSYYYDDVNNMHVRNPDDELEWYRPNTILTVLYLTVATVIGLVIYSVFF
jgi:hypothetical protein